jgi:hypothetical protein
MKQGFGKIVPNGQRVNPRRGNRQEGDLAKALLGWQDLKESRYSVAQVLT